MILRLLVKTFSFKGHLEANLSTLFKKLVKLQESLKTVNNQNLSAENAAKVDEKKYAINTDFLPMHRENLRGLIEDSLSWCAKCCTNLFNLSLIVPNAPWVSKIFHFEILKIKFNAFRQQFRQALLRT
jgi:hypothetical protein